MPVACPAADPSPRPPAVDDSSPVPDSETLSPAMRDLLQQIDSPQRALAEARDFQANGQFGLATLVLERGLKLAKPGSEIAAELRDELDYDLPMLQVREWLVLGFPDKAAARLEKLALSFGDDSRRRSEIEALQAILPQAEQLRAMQQKNEREVSDTVRQVMQRYYRDNGYYPLGYADLNRILPPSDSRLQNYEVIFFRSAGNAYRLVLRNLDNPENFLTIEATGLIR